MADKITTNPSFNPSGNEVVAQIKEATDNLIQYIEDNIQDGRRRSIALTNYEQAAMWAVKSVFDGVK